MKTTDNQLVVAVSSRALFDLEEEHQIFESHGIAAYRRYQIENRDTPLRPGVAFSFVARPGCFPVVFSQEAATSEDVPIHCRNASFSSVRNSISRPACSMSWQSRTDQCWIRGRIRKPFPQAGYLCLRQRCTAVRTRWTWWEYGYSRN